MSQSIDFYNRMTKKDGAMMHDDASIVKIDQSTLIRLIINLLLHKKIIKNIETRP